MNKFDILKGELLKAAEGDVLLEEVRQLRASGGIKQARKTGLRLPYSSDPEPLGQPWAYDPVVISN